MRAGRTTFLGGANVPKARRHCGTVVLALLLLRVQTSGFLLLLVPTSPARSPPSHNRFCRQQDQGLTRLHKPQLGSFLPAQQRTNKDQRRVTALSSSVHRRNRRTTAAVVAMGASSSRSGASSSPQQSSTLIGDNRSRGGGGGYGTATSDTRLGAAVSGEPDPEDPGTGDAPSRTLSLTARLPASVWFLPLRRYFSAVLREERQHLRR